MMDDELLVEVRGAAEAAIEAQVASEDDGPARERALTAARAALDSGHAISVIANAEAEGERAARDRLGAQLLRAVERAAKRQREATAEYERTIAQAVAIGLAARDIAGRAGVSHGTVAAVARRVEQAQATPPTAEPETYGEPAAGAAGV